MLSSFSLRGYRSLQDFSLRLSPITVIQGTNGTGKSNIYGALQLCSKIAEGDLPRAIAAEGGTASCFWAGEPLPTEKRQRACFDLKGLDFSWSLTLGLVPTTPGDPTAFRDAPDFKSETLEANGRRYNRKTLKPRLSHTESLLSGLRNPADHPELAATRENILSWRFYDLFRSDRDSPLRRPGPRIWSPILDSNGSNLAAALQTIFEGSFPNRLHEILAEAFPDYQLSIESDGGLMDIAWQAPQLKRPLRSHELSDGTLRFLALSAALLSEHPPSLLILNEPETSLNPVLYPLLSKLVGYAAGGSQILIVTHSSEFSEQLAKDHNTTPNCLTLRSNGATCLAEDLSAKAVWRFD